MGTRGLQKGNVGAKFHGHVPSDIGRSRVADVLYCAVYLVLNGALTPHVESLSLKPAFTVPSLSGSAEALCSCGVLFGR